MDYLKLLEDEGFWAALSNVNPHAMDMINHSLRVCVNDQVHLVRVQTGSSTSETKVDRIVERILRLLTPSQCGDE
jgi:hypothetical protein